MNRFLPCAVLAAGALFSSWCQAGETARGCSNASLEGGYAFTASGSVLPSSGLPAPLVGPFASFGTATYDGAGNVTLEASAAFNGVIRPVSASGVYQVSPDCTFTSRLDNGVTFYAVITGRGDLLMVQQTTPGTVISGTAERLARRRGDDGSGAHCSRASVSRRYGFLAVGYGAPPYVPAALAGPQSGVGIVRFDRHGRFTIDALSSTNGQIDAAPQQLTGTYTLSRTCALTMTADIGLTFTGKVLDGGEAIAVVETDPGATVLVRTRSVE